MARPKKELTEQELLEREALRLKRNREAQQRYVEKNKNNLDFIKKRAARQAKYDASKAGQEKRKAAHIARYHGDLEESRRKNRENMQKQRAARKEVGDRREADRQLARRKTPEGVRKFNEWRNKRYAEDPAYRMLCCLRTRLRAAFKNTGATKDSTCRALTGCSLPELQLHLESQFTEGMTWDNFGEWHVDHKKACALFDLSDPAQAKECFHYTNLQPLWEADRWTKTSNDLAAIAALKRGA